MREGVRVVILVREFLLGVGRKSGRFQIRIERRVSGTDRAVVRYSSDLRRVAAIGVVLLNRGDGFRDILATGRVALGPLECRQSQENHEENQPCDREDERDFDDREAGSRESFSISRETRLAIFFAD